MWPLKPFGVRTGYFSQVVEYKPAEFVDAPAPLIKGLPTLEERKVALEQRKKGFGSRDPDRRDECMFYVRQEQFRERLKAETEIARHALMAELGMTPESLRARPATSPARSMRSPARLSSAAGASRSALRSSHGTSSRSGAALDDTGVSAARVGDDVVASSEASPEAGSGGAVEVGADSLPAPSRSFLPVLSPLRTTMHTGSRTFTRPTGFDQMRDYRSPRSIYGLSGGHRKSDYVASLGPYGVTSKAVGDGIASAVHKSPEHRKVSVTREFFRINGVKIEE